MPEDEPIHAPDAVTPLKIPLSMTGRLAAAMGLLTVAAFGLAIFLKPGAAPSAAAPAAPAAPAATAAAATPSADVPSAMPKKVHTVSIRPERETVGQASSAALSQPALAQSDAGTSDDADALPAKPATTGAAGALPVAAPLKMWAMFPGRAG